MFKHPKVRSPTFIAVTTFRIGNRCFSDSGISFVMRCNRFAIPVEYISAEIQRFIHRLYFYRMTLTPYSEQNNCHYSHCHENAQPAPCPLFQLIRSVSEVTVPMPDLSEADKIKRGLHPLYSACSGTASTSILAWADPAK